MTRPTVALAALAENRGRRGPAAVRTLGTAFAKGRAAASLDVHFQYAQRDVLDSRSSLTAIRELRRAIDHPPLVTRILVGRAKITES